MSWVNEECKFLTLLLYWKFVREDANQIIGDDEALKGRLTDHSIHTHIPINWYSLSTFFWKKNRLHILHNWIHKVILFFQVEKSSEFLFCLFVIFVRLLKYNVPMIWALPSFYLLSIKTTYLILFVLLMKRVIALITSEPS